MEPATLNSLDGHGLDLPLSPEGDASFAASGPTLGDAMPQVVLRPFAESFGLAAEHGRRAKDGKAIEVSVFVHSDPEHRALIPTVDASYVFQPDLTKYIVMALEIGLNLYLTGHSGTGKTSGIFQCCARLGRPVVRVQHTGQTEEHHIVGQHLFLNGETRFELGPLPRAMLDGHVYVADEYDVAPPATIAVYQAVMEHQPLVIPQAPLEFRVIKPHPAFRFCGTGNTRGVGDQTGLYAGTQIQNAANFARWEVTAIVGYHDVATEARIVMQQAGITAVSARKFVAFAEAIRKAFEAGRIATTVGPRELINAARLGKLLGGAYRRGLELAVTNRMAPGDKYVADQMAQRIFG